MWKTKPTLTGRVTLWLTLLSVSLFFIIGLITFMVTLGNEDAMIHNILRNVSQNKLNTKGIVKELNFEQLIDFGYESAKKEDLAKRVNSFGEFAKGNQYFHFMILENKVLLMNSTEFVISTDRLKAILTLQFKVFIPFLLLAYLVARLIAKRSLRPFSLLRTQFLKPEHQAADIRQLNQHIRETDIRQIADGLAAVLEQKEQVLAQQITFNQGISHELRTPLQVISHAVELIALKNPELKTQDVYHRLISSISRMHRMGEALLWLTSNVESHHQIQVSSYLARLKVEIEQFFDEHSLTINLIEQDKLSLPFPEAVFEFIVYSLATNVIHHAQLTHNTKVLNITITQNTLAFKNLVDEEQTSTTTHKSFGLGLSIVEKLCNRFNVSYSIQKEQKHFRVTLQLLDI